MTTSLVRLYPPEQDEPEQNEPAERRWKANVRQEIIIFTHFASNFQLTSEGHSLEPNIFFKE